MLAENLMHHWRNVHFALMQPLVGSLVLEIYNKSQYLQDVDGFEEQCRWCGEGGKLVLCDKCNKAFCKLCIVRNFGAKMHACILNKKEWKCFSCDPEPLEELVLTYEKLKEIANSKLKSSLSESDQTLQDDNKFSGRRYSSFFPFTVKHQTLNVRLSYNWIL